MFMAAPNFSSLFCHNRGKSIAISSLWEHNQLRRSHPLNGDEGTITEYGSVRVTEWPLVDVFVLHPHCCVEY